MVDLRSCANCHLFDFFVDGSRSATIFAQNQIFNFARNHFVTTKGYVHNCHGTYDLAGRSYQRRIAKVSTYARHFFQKLFIFISNAHFFHLVEQVGKHTTGDLEGKYFRVNGDVGVQAKVVGQRSFNLFEVVCQIVESSQVQTGIASVTFQGCNDGFGARLAGCYGEGRQSGVDDVNASFNCFQVGHIAHAAGEVGVQVDGNVQFCFQATNEAFCCERTEQACHIFNADGVCAHLYQFFTKFYEVAIFMIGADGVNDTALNVSTCCFCCAHCTFQVAGIVQCVEDTHNGNAVINGAFYEFSYYVVSIVVVAQYVLTTEQHLNRSVGKVFFQSAKSFPGIFVQEAQARVKSCAAPSFYSVVAYCIDFFQYRKHVGNAHTSSSQRLVTVAQYGFNYFQRFVAHVYSPFLNYD